MDPIGASDTWVWHGYRNSYVEMNGRVRSNRSAAAATGAEGLWASARDHARFGYLFLREGNWNGRQIVSERWIGDGNHAHRHRPALRISVVAQHQREESCPSAPESSFFAFGSGGNVIWIDREHDLVVVTRWLDFAQLERVRHAGPGISEK